MDEGAELPHHHLAVEAGNQWELIVLLADTGGHGGAEQHGVHFEAGVAQCVLDDIERDGIHFDPLKGLRMGLDESGGHRDDPPST